MRLGRSEKEKKEIFSLSRKKDKWKNGNERGRFYIQKKKKIKFK